MATCINLTLMLWKHLCVRRLGGQFPQNMCVTQASKLLFSSTGNSLFLGQDFKIIFELWLADRHADISDIPREEKEVESPKDVS